MRKRFTLEICKRLPHSETLLSAILAVSSQHLSVVGRFESLCSDNYYQNAVRRIIPTLSATNPALNEEVLVATVILQLRAKFEGNNLFQIKHS